MVMFSFSNGVNLDLTSLMTDASDQVLAALREALADPVFGDGISNLQELKVVATNASDVAQAILRLYESHRRTNERLASVDAVLTRDAPSDMQTAYEAVRDFSTPITTSMHSTMQRKPWRRKSGAAGRTGCND